MSRPALRAGRREEILQAAGELFGERGYHAIGMRELAQALELKGSSLYAHIASKEDLLWEIVDRAAQAFVREADEVPEGLPPDERLRRLIAGHLRVITSELDNAAVFFQDWVHLSDERRELMVARRDAYQERFRRAIADGVRAGVFAVPDVELATLVVLSALNFVYHWYDPAGRLSRDDLAAGYAELLLSGLLARREGEEARPEGAREERES
ncbi:MAG TPA: TetR/AcrR family transcriptional regulator [Trueperaceae bacterium]|nr:TetR/AcrR family transcriptional regulator [Trueperaceae bacterium]